MAEGSPARDKSAVIDELKMFNKNFAVKVGFVACRLNSPVIVYVQAVEYGR
jgi:hypothetical protein